MQKEKGCVKMTFSVTRDFKEFFIACECFECQDTDSQPIQEEEVLEFVKALAALMGREVV